MEGLAKIGPWGGDGGDPQDIALGAGAALHRLVSIEVRSGGAIDALSFTYAAIDGASTPPGRGAAPAGEAQGEARRGGARHGGLRDARAVGPHACVVRSLAFVTSAGKTHGPFGEEVGGAAFRVPVKGGGRVVGFFARSGWLLDAVGVYVHP